MPRALYIAIFFLAFLSAHVTSKEVGGFKNMRADTIEYGGFAGHFRIPRHPRRASCNAIYVRYEDGLLGIVTSAHCIFKEGELKAPLSEFAIEFGFQLGSSSNQKVGIKSIRCGSIRPNDISSDTFMKDECFITPDRFPTGIKPIERIKLSSSDLSSMVDKTTIQLLGFHPKRGRSWIYGMKNEGPFEANKTRSLQSCYMRDSDTIAGILFFTHDCDSLPNTSGAAIIIWNKERKEPQMIGVHRGPEGHVKDPTHVNLAVTLWHDELPFFETR
jgi:hypothetical protein